MSKEEKPENLRDCWRTPRWIVDLAESYCGGPFGLDVAADAENSVVNRGRGCIEPTQTMIHPHYDRGCDALSLMAWGPANGRAWCNPPFSKLGAFVSKCIAEVRAGNLQAIGLLTIADISTAYWRLLESYERGREGVVTYRIPIVGRWSCEPPPGISYSTPTRPMAVWVLRRVVRAPSKRTGR